MFKTILVPVNFSDINRNAMDIAVRIAEQDKASVDVIHVIETLADTTYEEYRDFYSSLEQRSRKHMDELLHPYIDRPVEITPRIAFGDRVREILNLADRLQADLIVMNSHRIKPDDAIHGWGTISYKIGILAQCPVMLVK